MELVVIVVNICVYDGCCLLLIFVYMMDVVYC